MICPYCCENFVSLKGFGLKLMPAINDLSDVPTAGNNLLIVATVGRVLHFRMFDIDGNLLADNNEITLLEQGQQSQKLKQKLKGLWHTPELTVDSKNEVLDAATKIIGHASSEEHIFPQFLGGRKSIPACSRCNCRFGASFEASAFKEFSNWTFMFRLCGLRPAVNTVWREIVQDQEGNYYDFNQDLQGGLSKPLIRKDETGKLVNVVANPRKHGDIQRSLRRHGRSMEYVEMSPQNIKAPDLKFTYPINDDLRRLSLKMSLAAARLLECEPAVSESCRSYLLSTKVSSQDAGTPVRIAIGEFAELRSFRPPLGHLI